MKKVVGMFVCMLLVGAIVPVTASYTGGDIGNNSVEISTELCGINDGEYNVLLANENAEKVKLLIDDIKNRLDEIESKDEAVKIFDDAITELYSYGLFNGLGIEKIQSLAYGWYKNPMTRKVFENKYSENIANEGSNLFCLIAGKTDKTQFLSRHTSATTTILEVMFRFEEKMFKLTSDHPIIGWPLLILYELLYGNFGVPLYLIWAYGYDFSIVNPLAIGHLIYFGDYTENEVIPADGWLSTFGLNGRKSWSEGIIGQISSLPISWIYKKWYSEINPGVAGFTGIKLDIDGEIFYFGSALRVSVSQQEV